ncbi:T9SS type A sorting domain-containing protein [Pontibacter cellulosilyticus]|uniref:T9SS type A sorting domain-containing protein n=1 Tax=Pontibacter cellulosilyticus TaxID=1720253 RepID=A0A923N9U5_9BACT|nr:T9SS type A sorting domain-containing protein [Pontibacter cellulosilyticus]MBC5993065.1 T9SS type A sorting domain-containing protein [Pontibacter cellulosilyticus]
MKRHILLFALLFFSLHSLSAQSNCTQTDACFEYKLLGATRFDDDHVKLIYTVKILCNNNLDYIAFELPEGSKAATPSNILQQNNDYVVRNGRTSNQGPNQIDTEFNSIQFNAKNTAAINNGEEDLFEFYLTNADYDALAATGMRVQTRTSNGTIGQVTFDLNACAAVPAPGQDPDTACELDLNDAVFGFVDAMNFPDGTTTIRFLLKNNTAADVEQVLIETPATNEPIAVASDNNGSAYKAKYSYSTTVDQEANLITFNSQNTKGYANGGTDIFAVTIPTALYQADPFFQITLSAGGTVVSSGLNTQTCEDTPISPLAVELTSFEGIATPSGIELNWSTASETNNAGFEVERSQNGKTYTTVGTVAGAGNSNTALHYTYTDASAEPGTNYYRLKQVDHDGTFEYSNTIAVTQSKSTTTDNLSVYPNPATGNYVTVGLKINKGNGAAIQIMDMNGQVVFSEQMAAGTSKLDLPLSELKLPGGIYMVKLHHDNKTETKKLIIP